MKRDMPDNDARPRRRRPLLAIPGWLLFVCFFLPTLEVCGEPAAPFELARIPAFVFVLYAGAALLGLLALLRSIHLRRVVFSFWFATWFATAVLWLALMIGLESDRAFGIVCGIGLLCAPLVLRWFHRRAFTERAFWIGSIVHGAIATIAYTSVAASGQAIWGAFAGLALSLVFLVCSFVTYRQHVRARSL